MNSFEYRKFKSFKWIMILVIFLSTLPAYAQSLSLEELIVHVQNHYEKTRDLRATFVQRATIKSVNQTLTEEGTVYFKKPTRMLWDYSKPSHKKLVINPEKSWLYIPEDNIAYVQDAQKVLSSKMTIRFIAGIGKLKDDFHIMFPEQNAQDENGNYLLSLTPKSKDMGIEKLQMKINKDTFSIMNFSFTDAYGNMTGLTFDHMKTNTNLPDDMFNFTPPDGVEIFTVP
ncbi:MAG: outer membrane lipoprotein carrier protein LolA [Deltaproteobacteria bacterium]|nr:outer membrane lipoprotein carrier protein LolA [Deltaproteobacteria bacterium]